VPSASATSDKTSGTLHFRRLAGLACNPEQDDVAAWLLACSTSNLLYSLSEVFKQDAMRLAHALLLLLLLLLLLSSVLTC
jgi:hypothetical protein